MAHLNILSKAVAYGDPTATGNPLRKHYDWQRNFAIKVSNPKAMQEQIPAGQSFTFFSGARSTNIDGTTAFDITANPALSNTYRFTHSAGTAPVLRVDRGLAFNGRQVTIAVLPDASVTMTVVGTTWGTTAVGDTVFIPGPTTGDAATPFDVLNEGAWVVLAVLSATVLQCARPTGIAFAATGAAATVTANSQILAFSATGIQVGDQVSISAAFAASTQKTFTITQVTVSWFEIASTTIIPLETAKLPTATGMLFYSSAKSFTRVESNQQVSVRLNGASGDFLLIAPVDPADAEQIGWFETHGPVWAVTVINKSSQIAIVDLFTAE